MLRIILWACQHCYLPHTRTGGSLQDNDDNVRGERGSHPTTSRARVHPLLSSGWALRIETACHLNASPPAALPDQRAIWALRAILPRYQAFWLHVCKQLYLSIAFSFWKFALGLICYFLSERKIGWHVQNDLARICSFSTLISAQRVTTHSGSAFVGIKGDGGAPSPKTPCSPPCCFLSLFHLQCEAKKTMWRPKYHAPPPKAWVHPAEPYSSVSLAHP